jgi:putative transposase
MNIFERERTSIEVVMYALYLYFPGLNSRSTSKVIQLFGDAGRSHAAIWEWVQKIVPNAFTVVKEYLLF